MLASMLLAAWIAAEGSLRPFALDGPNVSGYRAELTKSPEGRSLRARLISKDPWPAVRIEAQEGFWDLSAFEHVAITVKNLGDTEARVGLRLDDKPKGDVFLQTSLVLAAGQTQTIRVPLTRPIPDALKDRLFGMRGYPGGWTEKGGIDVARVRRIAVFAARPKTDCLLELSGLVAAGQSRTVDTATLFPLIDRFGQYAHADWPGKLTDEGQLAARRTEEAADLDNHAGPKEWNRYGGWKLGPRLAATGRFYPARHGGKWWLVDPDGCLFWSHGIDCVRPEAVTPITDRLHLFAELPPKDSPLAQFYGRGWGAAHGYYEKKAFQTYNFTAANLWRKYGQPWRETYAELAHRRLRSWNLNTIGNWSDLSVARMGKTPYVVAVTPKARTIEASAGYWGKFVDPFDPGFADVLKKAFAREQASIGDPFCLGYFVGNELSWGEATSLASAALASPPDQPAKVRFVEWLKSKYGDVARLNAAWKTSHADWDERLRSTTLPDKQAAAADLGAFYTTLADEFFRQCRQAVKAHDPAALYLGCRFAWTNELAVRAATPHCDVVSFNKYTETLADFRLPDGVDKPVVIGEFHFGALDRGMFSPGLRPVADQHARAEAYARYVESGAVHPQIVGTHWFQFGDQATTGRSDGENYQIGFVNVSDTPYPETIAASRRIGGALYRLRSGTKD